MFGFSPPDSFLLTMWLIDSHLECTSVLLSFCHYDRVSAAFIKLRDCMFDMHVFSFSYF